MRRVQTFALILMLFLCVVVVGCDSNASSALDPPVRSTVGSPAEVEQYLKDNQAAVTQQKEIIARRNARRATTADGDRRIVDPPAENWLTAVVKAIVDSVLDQVIRPKETDGL